MVERNLADSPAYWDYLQTTTEDILKITPWEPPSEARGYDLRLQIAPEVSRGDCDTLFVLQETRLAEGDTGKTLLEYALNRTFAPGTPVLSARHKLAYDLGARTLAVRQKIEGPMTDELRQKYPVFVIPTGTEQVRPVQASDYELLAKGLTRIRRFKQL